MLFKIILFVDFGKMMQIYVACVVLTRMDDEFLVLSLLTLVVYEPLFV